MQQEMETSGSHGKMSIPQTIGQIVSERESIVTGNFNYRNSIVNLGTKDLYSDRWSCALIADALSHDVYKHEY